GVVVPGRELSALRFAGGEELFAHLLARALVPVARVFVLLEIADRGGERVRGLRLHRHAAGHHVGRAAAGHGAAAAFDLSPSTAAGEQRECCCSGAEERERSNDAFHLCLSYLRPVTSNGTSFAST